MKPSIDLVREFHEAFGCAINDKPTLDDEPLNSLRISLNHEEGVKELTEALASRDPAEVLDSLADAQYVLDGAFISLGFAKYKDAAVAEVHRSNMTKLGADGKPVLREDGKIIKGPNFQPPDLKGVMDRVDQQGA